MGNPRKTLAAMLKRPTPANIAWADIEALLVSLGATVTRGTGSRVKFDLNGVTFSAHRPHPQKEARRYQVRDAIDFLRAAGMLEEGV